MGHGAIDTPILDGLVDVVNLSVIVAVRVMQAWSQLVLLRKDVSVDGYGYASMGWRLLLLLMLLMLALSLVLVLMLLLMLLLLLQ